MGETLNYPSFKANLPSVLLVYFYIIRTSNCGSEYVTGDLNLADCVVAVSNSRSAVILTWQFTVHRQTHVSVLQAACLVMPTCS